MKDEDFVELIEIDASIVTDVVYATENNFVKTKVYPSSECFLRRKVAEKLSKVQAELRKLGLGLKVWDGYRPLSVQKKFWEILPDRRFIGDPAVGSKHNRGAAVDLTIIDMDGKEFEMPTPFDSFSEKAHRDYDNLSQEVIANRQLLEDMMISHGFVPLPTEWWHFDDNEWEKYPVVDFSFDELKVMCK